MTSSNEIKLPLLPVSKPSPSRLASSRPLAVFGNEASLVLLVNCLVEQLCRSLETSNDTKRRLLQKALLAKLSHLGVPLVSDGGVFSTYYGSVQLNFSKAFSALVENVRKHLTETEAPFPAIPSAVFASVPSFASPLSYLGETTTANVPATLYFHPLRFRKDFKEDVLLGQGGFGGVWKATHRLDGCSYAIKKVLFRLIPSEAEASVSYVIREARSLSSLGPHPHVVGYRAAWLEMPSMFELRQLLRCKRELSDSSLALRSVQVLPTTASVSKKTEKSFSPELLLTSENIRSVTSSESEHLFSDGNARSSPVPCSVKGKFWGGASSTDSSLSNRRSSSEKKALNSSVNSSFGFAPSSTNRQTNESKSQSALSQFRPPGNPRPSYYYAVLYLQMELCEGGSLQDYLNARGPTQVSDGFNQKILYELLLALNHVHSKGVIHRDLKPQNILFTVDGKVKLGDFGLAAPQVQLTGHGGNSNSSAAYPVGTALYAAPEQIEPSGKSVCTDKSDIYALGIVLLELYEFWTTRMERQKIIQRLRTERRLPDGILRNYPIAASWILSYTCPQPEDRPSAEEALKGLTLTSRFSAGSCSLSGERSDSRVVVVLQKEIQKRDEKILLLEAELKRLKCLVKKEGKNRTESL